MKIACLFPGYGSQFVGMAKELYDEYRIVQEYFEQANYCLPDLNFIKLCFASSDVEISQMQHAYTASFLVSSALYGLLREHGFKPDVVLGCNQGEYAALYAAKSFSFPDGIYLLSKYAAFYTQALASMKVSLTQSKGLSLKKVNALCKTIGGDLSVALSMSDTVHSVGGSPEAVDAFRKAVLAEHDATVDDQSLEIGLHSPLMNGVVDQFKMYLEKVDFKDPQIPFMSGINGAFIRKGSLIKKHTLNNINMSLRWDKAVAHLADYDLIVQMGPGTTLIDIIKQRYPEKKYIAINKKVDVQELLALIAPVTPATPVEQKEEQSNDEQPPQEG